MAESKTDRDRLLDAALGHVCFVGWNDECLVEACRDIGISVEQARVLCPRGALDLAVDYHRRADAEMIAALNKIDLSQMRFRDRVALAVRLRIEAVDKELVRRGSALFSLPQNIAEGGQLIWGTADAIWTALGDVSEDANWYTKRATLSAVYGSTVLFWLGDDSEDYTETWAFLDRRIDNVMQFEKLKSNIKNIPGVGPTFERVMSEISKPKAQAMQDVPGTWKTKQKTEEAQS